MPSKSEIAKARAKLESAQRVYELASANYKLARRCLYIARVRRSVADGLYAKARSKAMCQS